MLIIVFIYLFPKIIIICLYLLVSEWHYLFNFYQTKEGSNNNMGTE